MAKSSLTGFCSACGEARATNHYHDENLEKIELCKECYDQYLAKEMVQYWKDHIEEEMRRSDKSR